MGLSPQVRGNLHRRQDQLPGGGPIPAGAGEPPPQTKPPSTGRAYPRRCGGTADPKMKTSVSTGLSPQVRGNLAIATAIVGVAGPIPAGAGEPVKSKLSPALHGAYPRRCGGTVTKSTGLSRGKGLSPQVRGNRRAERRERHQHGPIPAGAGEPPSCGRPRARTRAYPRRCGGTHQAWSRRWTSQGLSPQVRGNRYRPQRGIVRHGPIPAGAGEPLTAHARKPLGRAYPRRCGGTGTRHAGTSNRKGLSPQVRGNRDVLPPQTRSHGPIPAGAGEP